MQCRPVLLFILFSCAASVAHGNGLPERYATRGEADQGGCHFAALKKPDLDNCVVVQFVEHEARLGVFDFGPAPAYSRAHSFPISSWYWGATTSFIASSRPGVSWLVVETEGMRGTGVSQRVLLVLGWDGKRFQTVAAESLDYTCTRPLAAADYKLTVSSAFEPQNGPTLRLSYVLSKNNQAIARWSDIRKWDEALRQFGAASESVELSDAQSDAVRQRMAQARSRTMSKPLVPEVMDSSEWLTESGLLRVLGDLCGF